MTMSDYAVKYKPYKNDSLVDVPSASSASKHWFDGCQYKCTMGCSFTAKSRTSIAAHVKSTHKEKSKEGVNFAVIEESFMACILCSVDVYKNECQIRQHLTTRHSITMEDFAEKFVKNGELEDGASAPPPLDLIKGIETPKNIAWYDRCGYRCKSCMAIFWSVGSIKPHLKKCQEGEAEKETVRNVIHICRTCGYKVLHERAALDRHVSRHGMSLSDYAVKYAPYAEGNMKIQSLETEDSKSWFDRCEYKCSLGCSYTAKGRTAMSQHLKYTHKEKANEGVNYDAIQEEYMQCQICSVDMFWSEGQIRAHLQNHSMTLEDYAEKYVKNGIVPQSAPKTVDKIEGIMPPKNIAWYDRCAYRCKECMAIFWIVKAINGHIKKCKDGKAEKEIVRTTIHVCNLCDYKVLHERSALASHIINRHNISMSDYAVKYAPYDDESRSSTINKCDGSKNWFDRCEYKCALGCSYTAKSRSAISLHLKSTHKEKANKGVNFQVIQEEYMQCQICSVDMFWCEAQIRIHFNSHHATTLEDYAMTYVKNGVVPESAPQTVNKIEGIFTPKNIAWYDRCAYRCMECMAIFWTVSSINGHIKKCNGGQAEKEIVRTTIHTCRVCGYKVLQEKSALASHIVNRHSLTMSDYSVKYAPYAEGNMKATFTKSANSKNWFDRCEYKCLLGCSSTAKSRGALSMHLKSVHKEKPNEGVNFKVMHEEYMQCQICSVDMFWNEGQIRMHLQNHSMTLEDYALKFVKDGIVPQSAPEAIDKIEGLMTPKNMAWYDRCAYRCKECMTIFWTTDSISRHIKKCKDGQAERELVRSAIHTCNICGYKVLQERSTLTGHIVKRHGMSMSDYAVKYAPYAEGKSSPLINKSEDSKNWFDGCEYKCSLGCSYTAKSRTAITLHLKCTHKEKGKEDVNFKVVQEEYMQCQICSVDMFRCEGQIRMHLQHHSMTLEDYGTQFVKNGILPQSAPKTVDKIEGIMTPKNIPWYDRCAYRCRECLTLFWTVKSVNTHIKGCKDGQAEKEMVRSKIHVCNLCGYKVLQERSALAAHITNRHGLNMTDYSVKFTPYADENPELAVKTEENMRWFDGCEYTCLLCSYSNKARSTIGHHLKSTHGVLKGSESEHFKVVVETSMDCALCSLSVTKNESQIRVHLTRAHSMTMEEYAAKFIHGDSNSRSNRNDAPMDQTTNEDVKVPKSVMW